MHPYLGAGIGYCFVSLTTSQIFHVSDEGTSVVLTDGTGGGLFFQWILGATWRVFRNIRAFGEAGYLLCANWDRIPGERVQASLNNSNEDDPYYQNFDWLIMSDRQIGRIHGLQVILGVQVGF